ncbi:FAD/NAD(P)-binding domain-containing protein [Ramaria rubella]|nr:FAD/NAD(P)-binding domain-containing protein [Ramaria rubella]
MTSKKNVVIVGAGGAGASLARTLSKQLDPTKHSLTLISARDHYLHLPGVLRMIITSEGNLEDRVLIPYDRLFHNKNGTFHQATVTSIVREGDQGGHVVTDRGEKIPFDVLVLASGSHWEGGVDVPVRQDEALSFIQTWREKFKRAKSIAIVGGGPVGMELAGEIRDIYNDKKITIVHGQPHLLSSVYPDSFRKYMGQRLMDRRISLILDDRINNIPSGTSSSIVTDKGVRVEADLVVPTRGGKPNTEYIATLGKTALNSAGFVKVDPTLQVTGFPGIFAAGDILDWKEVKQFVKGQFHIGTLSQNILSYLNGKPLSAEYKTKFEGILLSNGMNGGGSYIGILWGIQFGDWMTKNIKSKDLFISNTRKGLGYP